jgi:hypothetical protein
MSRCGILIVDPVIGWGFAASTVTRMPLWPKAVSCDPHVQGVNEAGIAA